MNRPTLIGEVVVAAGLTLVVALLVLLWPLLTGGAVTFGSMVVVVSLLYCGYRLMRSESRSGKVTLAALVLFSLSVLWLVGWSDRLLLIGAIGLIWGVRSWLTHCRPLAVVLDLLLTFSALAAAIWAFSINGVIAAVWCFFLLQALFVLIPESFNKRPKRIVESDAASDRFNRAHRNAETALRTLICREE